MIPTSDSENFRETDELLHFLQTFGHSKDVRTGVTTLHRSNGIDCEAKQSPKTESISHSKEDQRPLLVSRHSSLSL